MRKMFSIFALLLVVFCIAAAASPVFAQEAEVSTPVIDPSSFLYGLWTVVQPVVVLLATTITPVLGTWISVRLINLLKVSDEKQKLAVEEQLRNALHESAIRALKFAVTKVNIPFSAGAVAQTTIDAAMRYVQEKNPDTLEKLGVTEKSLKEIIMSKVPDLSEEQKANLKQE